MKFYHPPRLRPRSRAAVAAAVLGLVCGVGSATPLPAQVAAPPRPERIGADAPRHERNPAVLRPEAYQLRPAQAPAVVVETDAVKVKVGAEPLPDVAAKKKKGRAARAARAVAVERTVTVRKAEPVGPTLDELAAEREARRAERSRPQRVGNDAPHYERSGDPDVSAARIISIERP